MDITRAKEILATLAEGVDPTTGEILPDDSVCNKSEVGRALYTILGTHSPIDQPKKVTPKEPTDYDVALYERLKELRNKLADEHGLPPYRVLPNLPLKHLALHKPTTHDAFLKIYGVGKYTDKQYGSTFLKEIKNYINTSV